MAATRTSPLLPRFDKLNLLIVPLCFSLLNPHSTRFVYSLLYPWSREWLSGQQAKRKTTGRRAGRGSNSLLRAAVALILAPVNLGTSDVDLFGDPVCTTVVGLVFDLSLLQFSALKDRHHVLEAHQKYVQLVSLVYPLHPPSFLPQKLAASHPSTARLMTRGFTP